MRYPTNPRPSDEEIMRQLREGARKRRPWTRQHILIVLAMLAVPLLVVGWLLMPATEPPRLVVYAFDALAVTGEPLSLRARLEPVDAGAAEITPAGLQVYFEEGHALPHPGQPLQRTIGTSSQGGEISVAWTGPVPAPVAEFVVRYHDAHRKRSFDDRARIFTWPKKSALLIVDVSSTLTLAGESVWQNANILDIPAVPEAAKSLKAAEAKGYRVVYLAIDPAAAPLQRKVRGWVENRFAAQYPLGPVLGRPAFGKESTDAAREEILRDLQKRFTGPTVVVAGRAEAARASAQAGARTFLLREAIPPPGVDRLAGWSELPAQLPEIP
jgi:hypothetical protein